MLGGLILSDSEGEWLKTFKYGSDLGTLVAKWSADEDQSTKALSIQVEEVNQMSSEKTDEKVQEAE